MNSWSVTRNTLKRVTATCFNRFPVPAVEFIQWLGSGAVRPSFSASNGPHIVRVGLIVVVHVAIVQVHVPGVGRVVGVGRTRPVVVRLHAAKSVHFSRQPPSNSPQRGEDFLTSLPLGGTEGGLTGTTGGRSPIRGYDSLNDHACPVGRAGRTHNDATGTPGRALRPFQFWPYLTAPDPAPLQLPPPGGGLLASPPLGGTEGGLDACGLSPASS